MVVLVKLAAELLEIAYNHFSRLPVSTEHREEPAVARITIPRGWLVFCLVLVFISIMVAIVGPALAPYGYNEVWVGGKLAPPSGQFWLGTDNVGRDLFSRLLYGVRVDILAGLMCAGILSGAAAGWAILAAYLKKANNWLGDTLENIVMLPRDVLCAFPWLVLLLLLMSIVGPGFIRVALIGGLVLLPRAVGMMREAYHSPPVRRGWLYSVLWSIPVMFLFAVAGGILYTSSVSYHGGGIPPPTPELGGMISQASLWQTQAPWVVQWPSICLATLLLVWVMAGDALLERLGFRSKAVWAKVVE
jgi:peptide/nickel transport system permease protein